MFRPMLWIALGGAALIALLAYVWWKRRNDPAKRLEERRAELVSADTAARRALCLASMIERGEMEAADRVGPPFPVEPAIRRAFTEEQKKRTRELDDWLKTEGLWDSLSTKERTWLDQSFGTWNEQQCTDAEWRSEALHVILWALKRVESIPSYDKETEIETLKLRVGLLQPTSTFLRDSVLRPKEEITKARDRAETWLWRARTHYLQTTPDAPKPPAELGLTFEQIISLSTEAAEQDGAFRAIDGDFPVFGKAYAKVTEDEWSKLTSIATERLYGLNWLCGFADDWDSVPTET